MSTTHHYQNYVHTHISRGHARLLKVIEFLAHAWVGTFILFVCVAIFRGCSQ